MAVEIDSNFQIKPVHKPVLLYEVLKFLQPKNGEIYIDATFGAGGYSRAILEACDDCQVFAFDRDALVDKYALELKADFGKRFNFINNCFSKIGEFFKENDIGQVDGLILDLGVSSMQLDCRERGFSFDADVRLDMRMGVGAVTDAYEVVNQMPELDLARIISDFGEEKKAKLIAKKIVEVRKIKEIGTGAQLADIVRKIYGSRFTKIDPATKTFQAIRIYVNNELGELEKILQDSKNLLKNGGRLIVVSFHSLEDSIVKNFLREKSGYNDRNSSRYEPWLERDLIKNYDFSVPLSSAIKPGESEIKENIRSRSARMRVAIKN